MADSTRTIDSTNVPAPTEFGIARLLRDIRNAGVEPTHRFEDLDGLYAELSDGLPETETAPLATVLQFPTRAS